MRRLEPASTGPLRREDRGGGEKLRGSLRAQASTSCISARRRLHPADRGSGGPAIFIGTEPAPKISAASSSGSPSALMRGKEQGLGLRLGEEGFAQGPSGAAGREIDGGEGESQRVWLRPARVAAGRLRAWLSRAS